MADVVCFGVFFLSKVTVKQVHASFFFFIISVLIPQDTKLSL